MRNTTSKGLRKLLNLPRHPKSMTASERHLYRIAKRRLSRLPRNKRSAFLDSAAAVTEIVERQMASIAAKKGGAKSAAQE